MHSQSAHSRLAAAVAEEPHMPQAGKQGTQTLSQPDSWILELVPTARNQLSREGLNTLHPPLESAQLQSVRRERDGLDSTGPDQGLQRYGGAAGGDGARGATQRYAAEMPAGRLHIAVHSDVPHCS
ncbi:hypothetical protein CCHR01_19847 [Colletotrichum chrysophilum]|uniref:Uncharacterized protein n=1 Tax=Colletotrichum chrysophilum TaxID=1836956 RepID=A0AAD8ZXK5_9PEZI|nr:hypothetical protein CCHR01_19847 [Colletotrichum chrysophilum]